MASYNKIIVLDTDTAAFLKDELLELITITDEKDEADETSEENIGRYKEIIRAIDNGR